MIISTKEDSTKIRSSKMFNYHFISHHAIVYFFYVPNKIKEDIFHVNHSHLMFPTTFHKRKSELHNIRNKELRKKLSFIFFPCIIHIKHKYQNLFDWVFRIVFSYHLSNNLWEAVMTFDFSSLILNRFYFYYFRLANIILIIPPSKLAF